MLSLTPSAAGWEVRSHAPSTGGDCVVLKPAERTGRCTCELEGLLAPGHSNKTDRSLALSAPPHLPHPNRDLSMVEDRLWRGSLWTPPGRCPQGPCARGQPKSPAGSSKTTVHSSTQEVHQPDTPLLPGLGGPHPQTSWARPPICPPPPGQSWEGRAAPDLLQGPAHSGKPRNTGEVIKP